MMTGLRLRIAVPFSRSRQMLREPRLPQDENSDARADRLIAEMARALGITIENLEPPLKRSAKSPENG